jgi:hypothetical protein
LVELLNTVMVRIARRGSAPGAHHRRRRTRLDERLGDVTDVIDANLGIRPVYVILADPDEVALLAERHQLDPIDGVEFRDLARVLARREPGS